MTKVIINTKSALNVYFEFFSPFSSIDTFSAFLPVLFFVHFSRACA